MAVSAGYVVKETATNLRRNLLMTIASMLVVVISLGLTGAALITRQAVNKQTARWRGGVELSIFMKPDASQSQIDAERSFSDTTTPRAIGIASHSVARTRGSSAKFNTSRTASITANEISCVATIDNGTS